MNKLEKMCRVLYPHINRADFQKAAKDLGFVHHETRPGDGARTAYEEVWSLQDRTTAVNYLEDPIAGMNYLVLRGADLNTFETKFARQLQLFSTEETVELAAGAVNYNTQIEAIVRLAITFTDYDPDAYSVFEAYATQAPNPLLREAAVDAMGYQAWPEFRSLLEVIAAEDTAENVRRHAQEILPFCEYAE